VSNLNIPSTLANSSFLADLTTITGTDFQGSGATPATLGLATTYTVSLLTTCAQDDGGDSTCTQPKVGYWFNPGKDLKLESTPSSQGLQSPAYVTQLDSYKKVAYFLAVAYMVSAGSLALSIVLNILSGCFPSTAVWSLVFTSIATIFLLAASIVSIIKFGQLRDNFNATFGSSGLQTTLGSKVYIISFVAFAMGFLAAITLGFSSRQQRARNRHPSTQRGLDTKGFVTGAPEKGPEPGFLGRIPTWSRHKYSQIGKQPKVTQQRSIGPDDDRQGLVAAVEDDFSHEYPEDIAMGAMPAPVSNHQRDLNDASTAYDPYGH
jgi:hypothetical protein